MRSTIFHGILIAITALTTACSSSDFVAPVSAPGSSQRSLSADVVGDTKVSRSIEQYVWVSCTNGGEGEAVRVTGELRYDVHRTQDSSGVYHFSIKSNTSELTAVGLTTGTVFRGVMTERVNSRAEDYLNMDLRTADIIRFTATGSREVYSLMASTTLIIDQGTYVVFEQTFSEVCR